MRRWDRSLKENNSKRYKIQYSVRKTKNQKCPPRAKCTLSTRKMKQVSHPVSPSKHAICNSHIYTEIALEQLLSTQTDPAGDRRLATFVKVSNERYARDHTYAQDFRRQDGNSVFPLLVLRNPKPGALWK
jgi:hypothetical protein